MAEMNEIYTRIQLKYDSYNAWKTNNPTLLAGEVAIAKLVNENITIPTDETKNAPVLFKVGPGAFNDLPWVSGLAADVYAWAKKATPDWSDFPALPIEVIDNGTGKFITDFTYANNKLTITRSDVSWNDLTDKPEIPTELGVMSVITTDDEVVLLTPETAASGNVTITGAHKEYNKAGATSDVTGSATANGVAHTIKVPNITVDKYGHTEFNGEIEHTITIPTPVVDTNTAHTHSVGAGFKALVDNGGIDGDVKHELNLAFEELTTDNKLRLVDATTKTLIAEFDASEFVEDSYLNEVTYKDENGDNILEFVFALNNGTTRTVDVDLRGLVDVYVADETSLTLAASGSGKVFKIKDGGVTTTKIADKNVTEAKLDQNVQDALALARTALQEHQALAAFKTKQEAKTALGSTVKTVTSIKQNENGDITEVKFEDIGKIANAEHADEADVAKKLDNDTLTIDSSIYWKNAGGGISTTWTPNNVQVISGTSGEDAVLRVEGGAQYKETVITNGDIIAETVTIDKATIGGVDIKSNETATGAIKYLVFNCGSSTVLID